MDLSKVDYLDLVKEIVRRNNPESLFLYDFWEKINNDVFDGVLKPCIVYQAVQPYGKSMGYIKTALREICIQRGERMTRELIFFTLIHEMCHQWQLEQSPVPPKYNQIHYDESWCLILNKILEKFESEYRAPTYKRRKKTDKETGKRVNYYHLEKEIEGFTPLSIDEMATFPLPYHLPKLDVKSYLVSAC